LVDLVHSMTFLRGVNSMENLMVKSSQLVKSWSSENRGVAHVNLVNRGGKILTLLTVT